MARPTSEEIDIAVKAAFDELDVEQLNIFRWMTPQEKINRVSALFGALKRHALTTERYFNSELSDEEIHQRAIKRIMRASEWDEWMHAIFNS